MFSIILLNPQMGENIGAAARAMANFGFSDLRIVNPRDGWPNERAEAMAAGALDIMPPVQVFDSLQEAVSDLHYILGTTARPRDMVKPVYAPAQAVEECKSRESVGQKTGILFGAERTGLLNDEITACHGIITIPTAPDFSSLNLGQSVLLLAYEWIRNLHNDSVIPNNPLPASLEERENLLNRLTNELEDMRFFRNPDLAPTMMRNVRNIFTRADLTEQEIRTLHGVISALRGKKTQ